MSKQSELFDQFLKTWMGRGIDKDGVAGIQCVDSYKEWLDWIGYPNPTRPIGGTGYAEYIWKNRYVLDLDKYFDFVTSNFQYGDVMVYKKDPNYTPDTHVGHFVRSLGNGYHECFGFNQSKDRLGCIVKLPDSAVLGGLRLKEEKNDSGFTDVTKNDYFYQAVKWAKENGIVYGYGDGTLRPYQAITRYQAIEMIHRFGGSPTVTSFQDIPNESYTSVIWAYLNGIATRQDKFRPSAPLTRKEAVTFLYRLNGSPKQSGHVPYCDVQEGDYFYQPVLWAFNKVIASGFNVTVFGPDFQCTRGEFLTMLHRYNNQFN